MSKYTVKRLLEIAAKEVGYQEKESNMHLDNQTANAGDNNWTKYARDLHAAGYYQANKNGYAWCDVFVDWCFYILCNKDAKKAQELICQTGPYGAGCVFSARYYRSQNRFYTSDPQPGDQVFFGRDNDYEHTGIVEYVAGGVLHTIEGNTSNKVARRTYNLTSPYILGYGRPKYEVESAAQPTTKPTATKSVDVLAKEVIAGKWGNGQDREDRLTAAGYDYNAVQNRVNELLSGNTAKPKKSIDEIALEVIRGDWGNGGGRRTRLQNAGYDYEAVQNRVNELLK